VVFTYTQALLHDPFEKGITDNHQKRTPAAARFADGFRERYDFAEAAPPAFAASKYMLLDGFFIVRSEDTKPVVGEKGRRPGDSGRSRGNPHTRAQLMDRAMADHADVGLGDTQEVGHVAARLARRKTSLRPPLVRVLSVVGHNA